MPQVIDKSSTEPGTDPADGWLAQLYHENTKITDANLLETKARISSVGASEDQLRPCPAIQPSLKRVDLPRRQRWWGLDRLISRRRTIRRFSARPITMNMLSRLLYNASGVTSSAERSSEWTPWPLRSTPSAGALYPLELRVAALNVKSLDPGIYRYQPYDNCLETITSAVPLKTLSRASLHPELVNASAAVVGIFSDWRRLTLKYSDRGYRFALLEAGHMAQNMLLTCTAHQLAAVPVGGFLDDEAESTFGCESADLHLLYLVIVGRISPKTAER